MCVSEITILRIELFLILCNNKLAIGEVLATIINSAKKSGDLIIFSDRFSAYDDNGASYSVEPGDVGLVVNASLYALGNGAIEYTVLLGNVVLFCSEDGFGYV